MPKKSTPSNTTRVVTTSNAIRIEQPKSSRGKKPKVTVLVAPDEAVINQVGGFVNFLREHAVVGLAVGFIVGQQAQTVVKQLVDSFITPLVSLLIGEDLKKKQFIIHIGKDSNSYPTITWGTFIYTLINFLLVLVAIYVIIKFFKLDKLDKPKK